MRASSYPVFLTACLTVCTSAAPTGQDPFKTIVPGESELYNTYRGKAPPFPGNLTRPILPTSSGPAAPDDLLWQNLLAAERIVYSFYQAGVEMFNASSFTEAGFPNTTYDRIAEIRDNEAGHLNAFYDEISDASIKPGPCKYQYGFTNVTTFLAEQLIIEIGSMAFATSLVQQAKLNASKAAITSIGESETRHTVWALIDIWKLNPFGGPFETTYPYANQILYTINQFIVPDSCPKANPPYPAPERIMPYLGHKGKAVPGNQIEFTFIDTQPDFRVDEDYYVVYFHGIQNVTVPFDPVNRTSQVPSQFEVGKGIILASITSLPGTLLTEDSVIAGPLILNQQPDFLSLE